MSIQDHLQGRRGDGEVDGCDSVRSGWSAAMLDTLLRRRGLPAIVLVAVGLHLVSGSMGWPFHRCLVVETTGLPCPGCGLSRAGMHLLNGRAGAMWAAHPFAPYFVLLGVLLVGAAVLPGAWRHRWAAWWVRAESRVPLHATALIGFVVYGVSRLAWRVVQLR